MLDNSLTLISRLALRSTTAFRSSSRLLVLTFHRVVPVADPLLPHEPDGNLFRLQMSFLAENFRVLPLPEAVERLYRGDLPPRAACITFDDGYANNHDVALPILQDLGLTATFLVATIFLDGSCMWNDAVIESIRNCKFPTLSLSAVGLQDYVLRDDQARIAAFLSINRAIKYLPLHERQRVVEFVVEASAVPIPRGLMMNERHVIRLAEAGMDVGCHTVHHPILAQVTEAEARSEIHDSAERIAGILKARPVSFAYPNGQPGKDYLPVHSRMVRDAGFAQALTTRGGFATAALDRYELPRVSPLWRPSRFSLSSNLTRLYLQPV